MSGRRRAYNMTKTSMEPGGGLLQSGLLCVQHKGVDCKNNCIGAWQAQDALTL